MRSVTPSIESAVSRGAGLSGIKYCGGERAGGRSAVAEQALAEPAGGAAG